MRTLEIIPAVDLMGGLVVRLVRGDPRARRSYAHMGDPVSVALRWSREGADLIHVVDLDAALGLGSNIESVKKIIETVEVPVQVGGGIRSLQKARGILESGAERVIIGSMAMENPGNVRTIIDEYGECRVVVALDHLGGRIMIKGWRTPSRLTLGEALQKFSGIGVSLFLVTSVTRDGTLGGPDIETLIRICRSNPDLHVIAAGGIRSLEDLSALKEAGVYGVVIGTALYEGRFTLRDALQLDGRQR